MSKRRWQAWLLDYPGPAIKIKAHDMESAVEKALAEWGEKPRWGSVIHQGLRIGVQELVKSEDVPWGTEPPSLEVFTLVRSRCEGRHHRDAA